eukprot:6693466-Pyramimonas_sp.AAC.1
MSNLALDTADPNRLHWPPGANIRVSAEVAPWKTTHVQASGKCHAVWAQLCRNGAVIRFELGSGLGKTYVWARAPYEPQNGGHIVMICQPGPHANEGWTIRDEIKLYEPNLEIAGLEARLSAPWRRE